jgi:hypothetical protein
MKKFKPSKMVNWFEPAMLFQTGLRSVVSGIFGNYADRRETEAAITPITTTEWAAYKADYAGVNEIWVDYISDTGDGFNSTYSIAALAAQNELSVTWTGKEEKLPRAKLLLLGGDQVYPTPAGGLYKQKFTTPFEAAFPENKNDADRPHMYAIPGNHDWYDGLGGFLKLFCQLRRIGNWQTQQRRSYFARPLPNKYWIWGTDIQLDEDIDKPQLDYFFDVAINQMEAGSKVILITAEPAWVYKTLRKDDKTYDRFSFFVEHYITDGPAKNHTIAAILTGDLHHYSHYCQENKNDDSKTDHHFGAGGGGAFLHLTHNLPQSLTLQKKSSKPKKVLKLQKTFPDKKQSYGLLAGNIVFFIKNPYFSLLIGGIYVFFFWLLQSSHLASAQGVLPNIICMPFGVFTYKIWHSFITMPFLSLLSLSIIVGFCQFADTSVPRWGMKWFGLLHGLIQCFSIYAGIWLFAQIPLFNSYGVCPFLLILFAGGGIYGGFLMGIYLLLSNLMFGNHVDEASSSLACADYKCFLRMRINPEGLTIYPIGIKKTTKNWKINSTTDPITVTGDLPHIHLIEKPILIK